MNVSLMLKWIRACFTQRGPFLARTPSILLQYMDSYGSHIKEEVSMTLRDNRCTEALVIPPKITRAQQPLDVSLNNSLKLLFVEVGWTGL